MGSSKSFRNCSKRLRHFSTWASVMLATVAPAETDVKNLT
jgi:hypothetical protein